MSEKASFSLSFSGVILDLCLSKILLLVHQTVLMWSCCPSIFIDVSVNISSNSSLQNSVNLYSVLYGTSYTNKVISSLIPIVMTRFPRSVLEVSKKMLTDPSRNPVASTVENEAGWLLLSSLLACMPKEVQNGCQVYLFVLVIYI